MTGEGPMVSNANSQESIAGQLLAKTLVEACRRCRAHSIEDNLSKTIHALLPICGIPAESGGTYLAYILVAAVRKMATTAPELTSIHPPFKSSPVIDLIPNGDGKIHSIELQLGIPVISAHKRIDPALGSDHVRVFALESEFGGTEDRSWRLGTVMAGED